MDSSMLSEEPEEIHDPGDAVMMDNMDDLFGEAADGLGMGTGVVMPSAPLPAPLIARVADIQRTGCCSRLAWSNTGSIAQISKDGSKASFRTMIRNQKTGVYKLSDRSKHAVELPEGRHFVHLQFNGLGLELAVIDNHGGIHLCSVAGATGRMQQAAADPTIRDGGRNDLDAVVAMLWLPLYPSEFRSPYITPATKSESKWMSQTRNDQPPPRVHHPADNRNALLHVSATSRLSLLYQNELGTWQSTSTEPESWSSSEDLLSHAAIGEDGGHLILATHDEARRLRMYRITINWNSSQQSRGNMNFTAVAPTLQVEHLTALEHVAPQPSNLARLSDLRIISIPPKTAGEESPTETTVVAVFTYAPGPVDVARPHQHVFSVIARWAIESRVPPLHDSFSKLKTSGPTPVHNAVTVLLRQPDIISSKLILSLDTQYHNTMLAVGHSDGTIEFRNRSTWSIIEGFGDTTMASSLPQSGLGFFPSNHSPELAHNADGSTLATTKPDGSITIRSMTLLNGGWHLLDDGVGDNRGFIETAVVCLARQYAILCFSNASSDETLALLPPDLDPDMRVLFTKQILRIMCRSIDISMLDQTKQHRAVISEQLLPRAMSAQLVLGTKHGTTERTFAGQFAYSFLNLRLVSMALLQTLTRESASSGRADLILSLAGVVKWSMDFVMFVIDSAAQVKRSVQPEVSAQQACEQLAVDTGNPAMHLLLCSFPRILLKTQIFSMTQYLKLVQASIPRAKSIEERQQLNSIYDVAKSLPVTFAALYEFLAEFDSVVRNAYTEVGAGSERRMEIELAMMTEGQVPEELVPALQTLLDKTLPKLSESADMGKLYFWDTQWLGIGLAVPPEGAKRYDAVRKTPLTKGMDLRICRRCSAEMEDIPQDQIRLLPLWLHTGQRHCYCQNYWWLE